LENVEIRTDVNDVVEALSTVVAHVMVDDTLWRVFGYKSRPKRGAFFRRFVDKQKLEIEDFILRELLVLALNDVMRAVRRNFPECDDQLVILVGVLDRLLCALQYSWSADALVDYVDGALQDYGSTSHPEEVFCARMKKHVPDAHQRLQAKLLVGSVMLLSMPRVSLGETPEQGLILHDDLLDKQLANIRIVEKLRTVCGEAIVLRCMEVLRQRIPQ
jgi:hypothetical protein